MLYVKANSKDLEIKKCILLTLNVIEVTLTKICKLLENRWSADLYDDDK